MGMNDKFDKAEKQVKSIGEFYHHLIVYLSLMALLCIVDISDGGNWWSYWPAAGWGIFVVFNAVYLISHDIINHEWKGNSI